MKISLSQSLLAIALTTTALLALPARADLITPTGETFLEGWLGQGDLTFTKIYTKAAGDTAADFHRAVDGQGATFMLMTVSGRAAGTPYQGLMNVLSQLVGAYNPYSYRSDNINTPRPSDGERGAFLFDLTFEQIQRENLNANDPLGMGKFGALSDASAGPVFGDNTASSAGYHDLYVSGSLNTGYDVQTSFGADSGSRIPIVDGIYFRSDAYHGFDIDELEVYTFVGPGGDVHVPETTPTVTLLALGTVGLTALRRRSTLP
jgi:hypothetical protein